MTKKTTVAVLGLRYPDLSIEESVLAPRGVRLTSAPGATPADVVAAAKDAAVILAGSAPPFDSWVLERLKCVGIVRSGAGVESVDLAAASRAGMWVAYVPDYATDSVATHTVALLLAALRRLLVADRMVRAGGWGIEALRPLHAPGSLTVGIVGAGRIGRRIAELLSPFGFELLVHDAYVDVASTMPEVKAATLHEVLERSDVVTLHTPGSRDGSPLLGRADLDRLKPQAILVNTARGSLVDQAALIDKLRTGAIALAAIDVYESEPPVGAFDEVADRTILTPHMAWYTEESERDLRTRAAHEALRLLEGEPPLNVVASPEGVHP